MSTRPPIAGMVAPGFEAVRQAFEDNFTHRGELGAAVAAFHRGKKVVDLWGGYTTPARDVAWAEDTLLVVMSTTKGLASMTLAIAHARGWLDYDAPVAHYWPEFAQHGKQDITVRQLTAHEAGLLYPDEKLPVDKMLDLDWAAAVLARQTPLWPPGRQHGYHTMTLGLYMQELVRRCDPQGRSLGRVFAEEIAAPLGIEFYIGLPDSVPDARLATIETFSAGRALWGLRKMPWAAIKAVMRPGSLLFRSYGVFEGLDWNDRASLRPELPASNGVGSARAIARAYSAFAEGGTELGLSPQTFDSLTAPPSHATTADAVLGVPTHFSLGFIRPGPEVQFGSSPRAFGAPGAGGSFAFADPDAHLGYAYAMNKMDFYLDDDPRELALRNALYAALR